MENSLKRKIALNVSIFVHALDLSGQECPRKNKDMHKKKSRSSSLLTHHFLMYTNSLLVIPKPSNELVIYPKKTNQQISTVPMYVNVFLSFLS